MSAPALTMEPGTTLDKPSVGFVEFIVSSEG